MRSSPAHRMMSRRTRTLLPTATYPKKSWKEFLRWLKKRTQRAKYHNHRTQIHRKTVPRNRQSLKPARRAVTTVRNNSSVRENSTFTGERSRYAFLNNSRRETPAQNHSARRIRMVLHLTEKATEEPFKAQNQLGLAIFFCFQGDCLAIFHYLPCELALWQPLFQETSPGVWAGAGKATTTTTGRGLWKLQPYVVMSLVRLFLLDWNFFRGL